MRIAPGGWRVAVGPIALGAGAIAIGWVPVGAALAVLGVAVLGFYRDPERRPAGRGHLAPADGRVVEVDTTEDGRAHLAIFLNVWNVHVVRAPWAGSVTGMTRVDGHRRPSFLPGAATNAGIAIDLGDGVAIPRAGMVARRVRPYVDLGDTVERGDRIGHIAFGSRFDVVFPPAVAVTDIAVEVGDRVRAGETVVARATERI